VSRWEVRPFAREVSVLARICGIRNPHTRCSGWPNPWPESARHGPRLVKALDDTTLDSSQLPVSS